MMIMKRYLLPLAAAMMLACSFAFGSMAPADGLAYGYDQRMTYQDCDAVVSAQASGPVMQLPSPGDYRSPVMRSDMRVASAGMVFNRALDDVKVESTAPS